MEEISPLERNAVAHDVTVTEKALTIDLVDGRSLSVPLSWYPRLAHGTPPEWAKWELIGGGTGIHWPDLDEDICVAYLLEGRRSHESPRSIARWLDERHSP